MWHPPVVVGQREPELSFEPRELFGEAMGVAGQPPITLPLSQVVPLDEAGIDALARWQSGQLFGDRSGIAKDDFAIHRDDAVVLAHLDNLGIQPVGWWDAARLGIAAAVALARSLRPNPIGVEHGLAILWPLIAGEERDILVGNQMSALSTCFDSHLRQLQRVGST